MREKKIKSENKKKARLRGNQRRIQCVLYRAVVENKNK